MIYRSREQDQEDIGPDEHGDDRNVYEYVRPAASALSELAPENEFYAGGNRVSVDRIDVRMSPIETWRLCPSCDHCARVNTRDDHVACPRCGDVMWSDSGQRREMLPLRMVHAATPDRRARILDERDDREPLFHTRQLAADFEPSAVKRAYAMTGSDTPFGFEYIESATFREMNFGRLGSGGQPTAFAGLALPRDGFRVCRRCGTVQKSGEDGSQHTSTCSARKAEHADIADCLYLYREFRSEAVQMLLPVLDTPGSERRISSFVAALELGLRHHFSGRIDHLRAATRRSPRQAGTTGNSVGEAAPDDGGAAHQYLLLYDTVPSGTGYLKELMTQPEKLLSVFEKARDALKSCVCNQDPLKDGCYRCVFAYRRSREMAENLQGHRHRDARPHPGPQGRAGGGAELGRADHQCHVRQRAGGALRRGAAPGRDRRRAGRGGARGSRARQARLRAEGRQPHLLHGNAGRAGYASDGVVEPSRPDFLIRPARPAASQPPVAVFTDGFEFHRDTTDADSLKRMALIRGGFLVWSLTWHDLEFVFGKAADVPDLLTGAKAGDDMVRACSVKLDAPLGHRRVSDPASPNRR